MSQSANQLINHVLIIQSEVVPQFMDDGLADLAHGLAFRAGDAEDRIAEDHHLIGERRLDAEDAEELVGVGEVEVFVGRLVFHDDYDILEEGSEAVGKGVERLTDEALELHCGNVYQPGMMLKPNTQFFCGR